MKNSNVEATIKEWTDQGKPVLFHFDIDNGYALSPVMENLYDRVRGKVLFVRIRLLLSVFKEFGVKHVPAFAACWGDKKLKKIENANTEVYPPDDMEWWEKNEAEVNQMVDKLESKLN